MKKINLLSAVLICGVGLFGCGSSTDNEVKEEPKVQEEVTAPEVETPKVEEKQEKTQEEVKAKEEQERKQKAEEEKKAKEEAEKKAKEEEKARKEAEEKARKEEEAEQKELQTVNMLAQEWVNIVNEGFGSNESFYTIDEESKIISVMVDVPVMRDCVEGLAIMPNVFMSQWNEAVISTGELPKIAKQTLNDLGLSDWSVNYMYGDVSADCYWIGYLNDILIYDAADKIVD